MQEPKLKELTIEEAVEILRVLGSDDDPVIWHGKEMTPNDLAGADLRTDKEQEEQPGSKHVHIKFWGLTKKNGKVSHCDMKKGTLAAMVRDRLLYE